MFELKLKRRLRRCGWLTWLLICMAPVAAHATTDPTDPAVNHIVTRTDTAVFTADGVNTAGTEYSAADDMVPLAGSDYMEAQVYTKRYRDPATGEEQLRIYFSVHDIDANSGDRIDFYFDRLHNHGSSGSSELDEDLLLRITRDPCTASNCSFNLIARSGGIFGGAGSAVNIANAVVVVDNVGEYGGAEAGFQSGWTGELELTPTDLGWSYFPSDLGLLVIARSEGQNAISSAHPIPGSPSLPSATYPLDGGSIVSANAPANWANLKLRYPIDYAVVLDFSGSMLSTDVGSDSRWTSAKRAADLFVASLGLFKSDMLADQISLSQYSWSCSDDSESGNTTGAVPELAGKLTPDEIPTVPEGESTGTYTSDNTTDPASNNCTPIKAGIEFALDDQLGISGSSSNDKKDRIMILLSDGLHNQPSSDVPFTPGSDFSADEKAFTQIRTVAVGADGVADTGLLADISTAFNGGVAYSHEAKFHQVDNFSELLTAYLETLQAPLTINQIPKIDTKYSPGAPDKLVFIGVWNTPGNAVELTVTVNGGATTGDTLSYFNKTIGYAAIVVNNPEADGDWEIGSTDTMPDDEFVLADLRILARFLIEQKPYAAGDPMLLQVSLHDNGQPILGADVTVEAAVPGEGLGNYLTTVGDDCEPHEPAIPGQDQGHDKVTTHAVLTAGGMATGAVVQPWTLTNDPVTGRLALAAYHFEKCHKEGLDRNNLPGMKLLDDGTQGDLVAGDGIYSLRFTNTILEGSYNFRFFVVGKTADGMDFARMRVTSQYVGIEPDSGATETVVQPGPTTNGMASQIIFFLPKDTAGNYLGPGFAYKFKLTTTVGYMRGEVVDLNNGYYGQVVQYAQGGPTPEVTITTVDGTCFELVAGGEPPSTWPCAYWCWILLIVAVLLILILLICCLRRKR